MTIEIKASGTLMVLIVAGLAVAGWWRMNQLATVINNQARVIEYVWSNTQHITAEPTSAEASR